jgi:hypothetical protein
VASPESGQITGWGNKDWGRPVDVDLTLDFAAPVLRTDRAPPKFSAFPTSPASHSWQGLLLPSCQIPTTS